MKRVVVGLSGGVDSSIAAYLLKAQGYEVIGMFMRNWHDETVTLNNQCPWITDSNDALLVAQKLGIPFQTIDLSVSYKEKVVDYMFAEYARGRTPNPDICCNREIKFDVFLKIALQLGADYIATGHYARKVTRKTNEKLGYALLSGRDSSKDQSYFLCQLTQKQLSKTLFPIGELLKSEVRAMAKILDLATAEKKDSQGLCFVGEVRLPDFLQQQIQPKVGKIIEIPTSATPFLKQHKQEPNLYTLTQPYQFQQSDGKVVGEHTGAYYFTIGQRKGLDVGGTAEPLFVIAIDVKNNIVYVGQGKQHPGLLRKGLFIPHTALHWVQPACTLKVGEKVRYAVRIRYRQPLAQATLYSRANGLYIIFDEQQLAIAPGQFAAWYSEDELIGSGMID